MVFELPGAEGDFAARAARLADVARQLAWPALQAAPQQVVDGRRALQRLLDATVAAGGEGLVLHRADAAFEAGRSGAVLKLKPVQDAEAVVLQVLPGRGRHLGRMGALRVRNGDGVEFLVGTGFSDAQREEPPPAGNVITYAYRGFTATGVPRFASFLRLHDGL
jgi:DNA ligase-1